jgi:hypothetical protein
MHPPVTVPAREYNTVFETIERDAGDLFTASIAYLKYKQWKRQYIIDNNLRLDDPHLQQFHAVALPLIPELIKNASQELDDYNKRYEQVYLEKQAEGVRASEQAAQVRTFIQSEVSTLRTEMSTLRATFYNITHPMKQILYGMVAGFLVAAIPTVLLIATSATFREAASQLLLGSPPTSTPSPPGSHTQ